MEQLAFVNVPVGTTLASETREDFTVYTNPLVQIPPIVYASVHSPLEFHIDSPTPPDYGPNAPFGGPIWAKIFLNSGLLDLHHKILL